jgi:16S rRNA (guanine966-N2)-methyltransferase
VRQAIFNVLQHRDLEGFHLDGARAIDLFAGTGALGLEAISQGASYALFVEDGAESRALIRRNVETLGLTGATKIWRRDATNLGEMPAGAGGPFEVAFLDPPYRKGLAGPALESLRDGGWLAPKALVVIESEKSEMVSVPESFVPLDDRVYGETRVRYLRSSDL